jgi:hypothetical protein
MKTTSLMFVISTVATLAVSAPAFAKAHDQGIGDGEGAGGRTLQDLGMSNSGGTGAIVGGPGGVSAAVQGGTRGDAASTKKSGNKGLHGSVAGTVDDAVSGK